MPWGLEPIPRNVPMVFRQWRRWVVWIAAPRVGQPGKYDKIPRQPSAWLKAASTNNPKHWADWADAVATYREHLEVLSGIGLVLTDCAGVAPAVDRSTRLPLWAVDLDRCALDDPRVAVWRGVGCYLERSPSGNGYRGLGFGALDASYTNVPLGVEVYDGRTPRFVTVTGHTV